MEIQETMTEQEIIEFALERIDWWKRHLGLHQWEIAIQFVNDINAGVDDAVASAAGFQRWEYMKAELTFSKKELMNSSKDEIEENIVHELSHILVGEMREKEDVVKHEERVVTMLSKAFLWVRAGGE